MPSRSFGRAFADLADGIGQYRLWGHLGWQDIKQRYRRSVIGPLWITISMAVTAVALGLLYSQLFRMDIHQFIPFVTIGFIVWGFISGCVNEGTEVFIVSEGLIKHLPAPITVHVYRLVWRQILFLAHNMIVYVVMMAIFPQPIGWDVLLAIPALALIALNGVWVALLVGVISTRFRDIPPVTQSIVQLMFFMTPIVWQYNTLLQNPATAARAKIAELNPFLHFIEIVRAPLLGEPSYLRHWVVTIAITVVGWGLALLIMRNYRARVSYWV